MSTPRVAVRPADAIAEIFFLLAYDTDGRVPVYLNGAPNPDRLLRAEPRTAPMLARLAAYLDMEESAEVTIGLPQTSGYVYRSTVLWAWIRGGEQEKLAAKFRPAPSVVLKMGANGSERLLIWGLRRAVSAEDAEKLNNRISYCLHAARVRAKPELLRLPLPGTFLRHGRRTPLPVLLTRLHVHSGLLAEQVAGKLREPPLPWRERQGK